MSIEKEVVAIIAEQFGIEEGEVTPTKSFLDLDADSLDLTELMMTLEEKFNVEIAEDAAMKLKTVGEVIDYIKLVKPTE